MFDKLLRDGTHIQKQFDGVAVTLRAYNEESKIMTLAGKYGIQQRMAVAECALDELRKEIKSLADSIAEVSARLDVFFNAAVNREAVAALWRELKWSRAIENRHISRSQW